MTRRSPEAALLQDTRALQDWLSELPIGSRVRTR